MPGRNALHGDPAERRCDPVPLPPGVRGDASQRESCGPVDVLGAVHRHSPPHLARRTMRGVRNERALWRLPRPGLRDDRRCDGRRSLCTHVPGKFAGAPLLTLRGPAAVSVGATAIEYGAEAPKTIAWDDAAAERMKKIPAFVRGMVIGPSRSRAQERPRPRDHRRARADPRADADAEDVRRCRQESQQLTKRVIRLFTNPGAHYARRKTALPLATVCSPLNTEKLTASVWPSSDTSVVSRIESAPAFLALTSSSRSDRRTTEMEFIMGDPCTG